MRRWGSGLAALLALTFVLVGCGSKADTNSTNALPPASQSAGMSESATPSMCPSAKTEAFPKARFVADVGLIAGSFHHWIWAPFQAGAFQSGAKGRIIAIGKAAVEAALIVRLTSKAVTNVKADPLLCKVLAQPLADLSGKIGDLASRLKGGDVSTLTDINGLVGTLTSGMASSGNPVTETFQTQ